MAAGGIHSRLCGRSKTLSRKGQLPNHTVSFARLISSRTMDRICYVHLLAAHCVKEGGWGEGEGALR